MQAGAMTDCGTAERGGVAERRRFAPSPPCLPPDADPPPGAVPLSELSDEHRRRLLPAVAGAIDAMHRFRVAHGSLTDETVLAEGTTVWLAGVGAVWEDAPGPATPRQRDLAWFRRECERWLGPSVQPGVGRTCRGMLAAWREPPPAPKPARPGRPAAMARAPVLKPRTPRKLPWRLIGLAVLVASVVGTVAAWQLTPLPTYARRTLRTGFRKLPETVRSFLDPNGAFDPLERQVRQSSIEGKRARLEANVGMLRPNALIDVLTEPGDEYTELLRKFLQAGDAGFFGAITGMYASPRPWHSKSAPRLKTLLADKWTAGARRALEYCFTRAAGPEDAPALEAIIAAPDAPPESVAEAYGALARLGRPAPVAKLVAACADAGDGIGRSYLAAVLFYYPPEEARRYLDDYAGSPRRKSLADAWHETLTVIEGGAYLSLRERASLIFEKSLVEAIPRLLAESGPSADADLLFALSCLWRLRTVSPEAVLERLSAPTPQGERIRARLQATLIGSASDPPERLTLPEGWDIPDEWYGAVLAGASHYPVPFVHDLLFGRRLTGAELLNQQSRLLALANLGPDSARQALAEDLGKKLSLYRETWRTGLPPLTPTVCALLAAARAPAADQALADYLVPGPLATEAPAWEGLVVGAAVAPARHRALLQAAASHPLPTVWTRARDALALADGDVAAYRSPDRTRPALAPGLASLVAQLEAARGEEDVLVVLSRQRAGHLAETALGLTASPGAVAVLLARLDRGESRYLTNLLLANQPGPLDDARFGDFLRTDHYDAVDPPVVLGHVLRGDDRSLATMRAIALGPRAGMAPPPLLHRVVAMYAIGALQAGGAAPAAVNEILAVVDRDASLLVRHAAAAAALRCVRAEDKRLLTDFLAERPKLPPGVADVLRLAEKL